MPVRVTCECGQILNAPDHLAGKAVKCPKCQKAIRIPAAGGATAAAPAAASAAPAKKPGAAPAAAKPAASSKAAPSSDALASLFDQAGLKKREGTFCPSCDKALPPGTAICVACGFHLEQGAKLEGFQVEAKEFGDKRLVEAAEMMKREAETDKRLIGAGMPWWMMLAIVLGILFMITAVLLKMDVKASGSMSTVPMIAKIQRANLLPVLVFSVGGAAALIGIFAYMAIALGSFKESAKQGLLNLFAPFYIVYYMFSRMEARRLLSTIVIFWVSAIIAGICLGYSLPKI
ncbi:MAG: hypothetical protein ACK5OB_03215 [Pirellula sp.]